MLILMCMRMIIKLKMVWKEWIRHSNLQHIIQIKIMIIEMSSLIQQHNFFSQIDSHSLRLGVNKHQYIDLFLKFKFLTE